MTHLYLFSSKNIAEAGLPIWAYFLTLSIPKNPVIIPKNPSFLSSTLLGSFLAAGKGVALRAGLEASPKELGFSVFYGDIYIGLSSYLSSSVGLLNISVF